MDNISAFKEIGMILQRANINNGMISVKEKHILLFDEDEEEYKVVFHYLGDFFEGEMIDDKLSMCNKKSNRNLDKVYMRDGKCECSNKKACLFMYTIKV